MAVPSLGLLALRWLPAAAAVALTLTLRPTPLAAALGRTGILGVAAVFARDGRIDVTAGGAAEGQEVEQVVEGLEDARCTLCRDDPFRRGVVQVLDDDVDTDASPVPAKAMTQIGGHRCRALADVIDVDHKERELLEVENPGSAVD